MKSEIGQIIYSMLHDSMKGSERMKLQRKLSQLIAITDETEVTLNPGIYNQDGTLAEIPPVFEKEMGFLNYNFEIWKEEYVRGFWLYWLQKAFKRLDKKQ